MKLATINHIRWKENMMMTISGMRVKGHIEVNREKPGNAWMHLVKLGRDQGAYIQPTNITIL